MNCRIIFVRVSRRWLSIMDSLMRRPCSNSSSIMMATISVLKYEKSADIAMAQISGKDYAKAFADDGRKVVKVAVNFSGDQRSIEDWVIE